MHNSPYGPHGYVFLADFFALAGQHVCWLAHDAWTENDE